MLMVAVIVVGSSGFNTRRAIRRGMVVSRRGRLVISAKRHRNRMQVLQRQAGDQHQQRKFLQETIHAVILTVGRREMQAHVMTAVNGESSIGLTRLQRCADTSCAQLTLVRTSSRAAISKLAIDDNRRNAADTIPLRSF